MKFFSGFCFKHEAELFGEFLDRDDFCVAGFSYGATKAFEYVLASGQRIDRLQLFSPAFFQDRSEKFKRLQTLSFAKDRDKYIKNFLNQVKFPSDKEIARYNKTGTIEELEELLNYKWSKQKVKQLIKKGTQIEVYLGENDKIINSNQVLDFFIPFSNVYYIKNTGHLLR